MNYFVDPDLLELMRRDDSINVRFVFADWLDDRSCAVMSRWASMIRLHCQLYLNYHSPTLTVPIINTDISGTSDQHNLYRYVSTNHFADTGIAQLPSYGYLEWYLGCITKFSGSIKDWLRIGVSLCRLHPVQQLVIISDLGLYAKTAMLQPIISRVEDSLDNVEVQGVMYSWDRLRYHDDLMKRLGANQYYSREHARQAMANACLDWAIQGARK